MGTTTPRAARAASLAGVLLTGVAASGCSGLSHKENDELWAESQEHFDAGRYDEAEPYYDELLRRNETDTRARTMRAVSHERTGDESDALDDYATAGGHGEARALLYRADLNIRRGDYVGAEQDLAQLKTMPGLGPRDTVVQLTLLGTLRVKQQQWMLGAQSLERACEAGAAYADPTMTRHVRDAHYNAAHAYYRLGDFGRGYDHMEAYAQGQTLNPQDAYMAGLLAYLAGDFAASNQHLATADPELVARAADILDDPSFGASARKEVP